MSAGHLVASPVPGSEWGEVLASDPCATVYQTPAWFDAVRDLTGARDVSRLYVTDTGRRLVLPLLRRGLAGVFLDSSYPGRLGSGDLLATGGLRAADVRLVVSDLVASRAVGTRIKANHDTAGCWEAAPVPETTLSSFRVEVVDLEGGFARVWDRFSSSARRNVRKAERSDLTVERDTTARLVPDLYEVYLAWTAERAQKSGIPGPVAAALARRREPLRMFEALAESLEGAVRVWVARHQGEPVAALMTFVYGSHALYFRGYSRQSFGPLRANNLLQRLAIEDACEAGCRYYSMGGSSGVAGLEHFKQTMGATPRSAVECRIERLPIARLEELRGWTESAVARVLAEARGARRS